MAAAVWLMEDWIYAGKYPRIFMELIDRTVRRRTGGEDHLTGMWQSGQ